MQAASFNQSRPPPGTGCAQTLYPAGSYDCCIWQVGTRMECSHWLNDLQGGTPSLPGLGVGSGGGGVGESLLHILILTRLQDRGAHKPDPTKKEPDFATPNPIFSVMTIQAPAYSPCDRNVRRGCE